MAAQARKAAEAEPEKLLNEQITGEHLILIDGDGRRIGLVKRDAALQKIRLAGLDLIQLSPPSVSPPICKVVNFVEWQRAEAMKKAMHEAENKPAQTENTADSPLDQPARFGHKVADKSDAVPSSWKSVNKIVYLELDPQKDDYQPFLESLGLRLAEFGRCDD